MLLGGAALQRCNMCLGMSGALAPEVRLSLLLHNRIVSIPDKLGAETFRVLLIAEWPNLYVEQLVGWGVIGGKHGVVFLA